MAYIICKASRIDSDHMPHMICGSKMVAVKLKANLVERERERREQFSIKANFKTLAREKQKQKRKAFNKKKMFCHLVCVLRLTGKNFRERERELQTTGCAMHSVHRMPCQMLTESATVHYQFGSTVRHSS